jgi:CubicO group peptidase (beta-lactamase class C family)
VTSGTSSGCKKTPVADITLPEGIEGTCDERFTAVAELLCRQLASGAHHGAAVAVHHRGEPVVDIWGGPGWHEDTLAVSFSTTKGPAATALHMAMERAGVDYDVPITSVWPEFGKPAITIRHALCHEAGVPQIRDEVPDVWAMTDWDAMVTMMEGLEPLWEPGTANGYHAINFGWLIGELVRRIDGRDISTFVAEEIAGPLGLDGFFISTPPSEHYRVMPLIPLEMDISLLDTVLPLDSITRRALSPAGDVVELMNSAQGLSTCAPAISGAFTARSLAAFYATLERGGSRAGVRLLSEATLTRATTVQNTRPDLVIFLPMHWRLGFMGGGSHLSPAGPNVDAFGHAGFGGSTAVADPTAELAVAVTLDRLEINLLGGDRAAAVVTAAVAAASAT